jgi:hypothetical protein
MAAKRRQSRRKTARRTSRRHRGGDGSVKVSFIGKEIQDAIERINRQADRLPREGRLAAKVAVNTLRLCSHHIKRAVNCDFWEIK